MHSDRPLLEVCIDSVDGARAAEQGGADRLELCANLLEGGTTPSLGMVRAVLAATHLPVMVMIRPRGGHFCYARDEERVMEYDVAAFCEERIAGIVIGPLTSDGTIDAECCRNLMNLRGARQSVTFHRAFDQVANPFTALEVLVHLQVDRVLTSGQAPTASDGIASLSQLVRQAAGRIAIMPGCGVRGSNVSELVRSTGAREVHASASLLEDNPVSFWRDTVPMHASSVIHDLQRRITSRDQVAAIRQALDR